MSFNPGISVGSTKFTNLVYADDTALLLPSATDANTSLKSFSEPASHLRLNTLGQRQNYRTLVPVLNHQSTALFTSAVYNHRMVSVVQT